MEHAADTFNRFTVRGGGVTPYKELKGRVSILALVEFGGEMVSHMSKEALNIRDEALPKCGEAVFVGFATGRNEYLLGTASGVMNVHCIKRLVAGGACIDAFVRGIESAPCRFVFGSMAAAIFADINDGGECEPEVEVETLVVHDPVAGGMPTWPRPKSENMKRSFDAANKGIEQYDQHVSDIAP